MTTRALFLVMLAVTGCGPSASELCSELSDIPCPADKQPHVDPSDTCLHNMTAACSDKYRALVSCEIANPACETKNADGSLANDAPIVCPNERDAFLGCALGP